MRGLDCKVATDMRQDKTATAEDSFNVDSCGYGIQVSAPKVNTKKERLTRDGKIIIRAENCTVYGIWLYTLRYQYGYGYL